MFAENSGRLLDKLNHLETEKNHLDEDLNNQHVAPEAMLEVPQSTATEYADNLTTVTHSSNVKVCIFQNIFYEHENVVQKAISAVH